MKKKRNWSFVKMTIPAITVLSIVFVFPLLWTVWLSFTNLDLETGTNAFIGLKNYVWSFTNRDFLLSITNTLIYVVGVVIANLVLGITFALFVSMNFRGAKLLRFIIIIPMLFIPASSAVLWRLMFNDQFGIINHILALFGFASRAWLGDPHTALLSVMVTDIWAWTPYVFLLVLAGLLGLPREVLEAADVDGASAFKKFWYVTLPMLRPVLVIVILIKVLDTFKTFDYVWIMTGGGPGNSSNIINTYIYRTAFSFLKFGLGSSMSVIALLISLVVIVLYVRILISRRGQ